MKYFLLLLFIFLAFFQQVKSSSYGINSIVSGTLSVSGKTTLSSDFQIGTIGYTFPASGPTSPAQVLASSTTSPPYSLFWADTPQSNPATALQICNLTIGSLTAPCTTTINGGSGTSAISVVQAVGGTVTLGEASSSTSSIALHGGTIASGNAGGSTISLGVAGTGSNDIVNIANTVTTGTATINFATSISGGSSAIALGNMDPNSAVSIKSGNLNGIKLSSTKILIADALSGPSIKIGTASTSSTSVDIATGAASTSSVNIGTSAATASTIMVGSTTGTGTTTINAGSGNIQLAADTVLGASKKLYFTDLSTNKISFSAPSSTASYDLVLPSTAPSNSYVLGATSSSALAWLNPFGGSAACPKFGQPGGCTSTSTNEISIGQANSGSSDTVNIANTVGGGTATVNIAAGITSGGVAQVTIGSTIGATSSVELKAGSTNGIKLTSSKVTLGDSAANNILISSVSIGSGTNTISIGNGDISGSTTLNQIDIGSGIITGTTGSNGANYITIGNGQISSTLSNVVLSTISIGSGNVASGGTGSATSTINIGSGAVSSANGSAATLNVNIANGANTQSGTTNTNVKIATAATGGSCTIGIGPTGLAASIDIGKASISAGTNTISIGNGAISGSSTLNQINIGSGTITGTTGGNGANYITIGNGAVSNTVTASTTLSTLSIGASSLSTIGGASGAAATNTINIGHANLNSAASTTATLNVNIASGSHSGAAVTTSVVNVNIANPSSAAGSVTQNVKIATNGGAGTTSTVTIGSSLGTSSIVLQADTTISNTKAIVFLDNAGSPKKLRIQLKPTQGIGNDIQYNLPYNPPSAGQFLVATLPSGGVSDLSWSNLLPSSTVFTCPLNFGATPGCTVTIGNTGASSKVTIDGGTGNGNGVTIGTGVGSPVTIGNSGGSISLQADTFVANTKGLNFLDNGGTPKKLRFQIKPATALSSDQTYNLPTTAPLAGQLLTTTLPASGISDLSWVDRPSLAFLNADETGFQAAADSPTLDFSCQSGQKYQVQFELFTQNGNNNNRDVTITLTLPSGSSFTQLSRQLSSCVTNVPDPFQASYTIPGYSTDPFSVSIDCNNGQYGRLAVLGILDCSAAIGTDFKIRRQCANSNDCKIKAGSWISFAPI